MILQSTVLSRRGAGRPRNADSFLNDAQRQWFAVADGVGVSNEAAVASRIAVRAVEAVSTNLSGGAPGVERALKASILRANRRLYRSGQQSGRPMMSTLTAAGVVGNRLTIAHCGDCRAHLFQHGVVSQLTHDHTHVGDLLRNGQLSSSVASAHPFRHVLSTCLGRHERVRIDVSTIELDDPEFCLLLCSDGLGSFVDESTVEACLQADQGIRRQTMRLVDLALRKGSRDDITVLAVRRASDDLHPGGLANRSVAMRSPQPGLALS